jgi:hypothetical protein
MAATSPSFLAVGNGELAFWRREAHGVDVAAATGGSLHPIGGCRFTRVILWLMICLSGSILENRA